MKHYCIKEARGKSMRAWLLFGVRFEVRNVRSSGWDTLERKFQVETAPLEDDLIWTPDMVIEHPGNFLEVHAGEIATPAGFAGVGLQEQLEGKFLEYLLRYYR
ncbi:MAG: hypothetical protein HYX74_02805, partial [Acidobacteria bacterium]|nr:hypothetical protein [Acidobacteriota bacterium]